MVKRKPVKPCVLVTDASSSLNCKQGFTTGDVVSFISSKYGNVGETIRSIYTALRRQVDSGILKLTRRRYSITSGTPSLDLTQDSGPGVRPVCQNMRRRRVCRPKTRRRKGSKSRRRKTKRRKKSRSRKRKRGCRKKRGRRSVSRGRRKKKKKKLKRKTSRKKAKKSSRRRCAKRKVWYMDLYIRYLSYKLKETWSKCINFIVYVTIPTVLLCLAADLAFFNCFPFSLA